jgi:hypothetical protein
VPDYGLGRRPAPDARDLNFPMRALAAVAAPPTRTSRYWYANGWWGNQGASSTCVGHGWGHWLEDGPHSQPGKAPVVDPYWLYHNAQLVDEWQGEEPTYEGTSVRAGAKVLQGIGFIDSYHWAFDLDTVVHAVLEAGPVVVGTDWYDGFFTPDSRGLIEPTGAVAGGHCWVVNGVNTKTRMARGKQSWGRQWGRSGYFYLSFDTLAQLIADAGEACIAVEATPSDRREAVALVQP